MGQSWKKRQSVLEKVDPYLPMLAYLLEKNRVGIPVNQADPRLANVLTDLLESMWSRAQRVQSHAQRSTIPLGYAVYC